MACTRHDRCSLNVDSAALLTNDRPPGGSYAASVDFRFGPVGD
jgi:hypothetical protein